jgi:hypothetical protein
MLAWNYAARVLLFPDLATFAFFWHPDGQLRFGLTTAAAARGFSQGVREAWLQDFN